MTLAIHGGKPVRDRPFPPRPQYGIAERNAANTVVASGNLSGFLAQPGEAFLGGYYVRSLEAAWCEKFGVKHAIAMNSATSCLFGAVQAVTTPGDEVIVTPWSMSASATCVLEANCIPVFVDIDPETYCLDPDAVYRAMTPRTKAIVAVDLFGCPMRIDELNFMAGMPIIEDAAQAVGARGRGLLGINDWAGTLGNVGVFSLNRHKTIQCGEGGIAVTNDDDLAERLRDYRNHGEMRGGKSWGGNYRLGEIEAAIGEVQLGRLEELTEPRIRNAQRLTEALSELDGIRPPVVPEGLRHVYYLYAVRVKNQALWKLLPALKAEGIPWSQYVEPIHLLPVFRKSPGHFKYEPEVDRAYREVLVTDLVHAGMTDEDVDDVIRAFQKVWTHREEL